MNLMDLSRYRLTKAAEMLAAAKRDIDAEDFLGHVQEYLQRRTNP